MSTGCRRNSCSRRCRSAGNYDAKVTDHSSPKSDAVVISRRYRGPPDSANGGFACGLLGCRVHGPARVRLNRPPPLDRPLTLRVEGGSRFELLDADNVIAEGGPTDAVWDVPAAVAFDLAKRHRRSFRGIAATPSRAVSCVDPTERMRTG